MDEDMRKMFNGVKIKGFNYTTLIDWEGRVASIIFLGGCNFRCSYCHASSLVLKPDTLADIPIEEVKAYLKDKKDWISGLVVCGGEPTIYDSLPSFLFEFKKLGMPVKLDTNGSRPQVLKRLFDKQLVDYIAMDIKAPLEDQGLYRIITGVAVDMNKIKDSIQYVRSSDIDYEFRTTVVPNHLKEKDIISIARQISGAKRYFLQQFVPNETIGSEMMKVKVIPLEELKKIAISARNYVPNTTVRGR
ncbi:MAG: anaerobic ribonucleoside-triphosphate reductase activating protein [Candidatus Omnitrophica bacterium]|nr:anaerobic ribonucleoside-triphosphate reductase activating protein [Candidatus Omnitrophota bacterium]